MMFLECKKYKNLSGIYSIINLVNKKRYIGQTKMNFIKRFWHHQWMLNHNSHSNKHLQSAWNKYGSENFRFEVLHIIDKDEDFDIWEKYYIKQFDTIQNGYNIQDGGNVILCNYIPEESRKRVGELNRQRMIGGHLSDFTKKKMSESRIGSNNPFAKLTEDDVREIKKLIKLGVKPKEIYTKYNITYGNFKMIRSGKTWKHINV